MDEAVAAAPWVDDESTVVVRSPDGSVDWWTFAGLAANTAIAAGIGGLQREGSRVQNLTIPLRESLQSEELEAAIRKIDPATAVELVDVTDEAMEGLKFADCLPREAGKGILRRRMEDRRGVEAVVRELRRFVEVEQ